MTDLKLLWYSALGEPIGLLLQTADPIRARQALYRARVEAADQDLAQVQVRLSRVPGGNLLLIKETVTVTTPVELDSGDQL